MGGFVPVEDPLRKKFGGTASTIFTGTGSRDTERILKTVTPEAEPVDLPPPPAPEALPEEGGAGDAERRRLAKRSGRQATFLTGDLVPKKKKKTVLG